MAKFDIEVVETLSRVIEVEANDTEEAKAIVEDMYNNEEIILDWQDLESVEYKEYPYPKFHEDFSMDIDFSQKDNKVKVKSGNLIDSELSCKNAEELKISLSEIFAKMYQEDRREKIGMAKK